MQLLQQTWQPVGTQRVPPAFASLAGLPSLAESKAAALTVDLVVGAASATTPMRIANFQALGLLSPSAAAAAAGAAAPLVGSAGELADLVSTLVADPAASAGAAVALGVALGMNLTIASTPRLVVRNVTTTTLIMRQVMGICPKGFW